MASASELEEAGNEFYQNEHMSQLFEEGLSFSGFERDGLFWARGDGTYLDISGVSGLDSITDGRGLAYGDLDNDGDLDVAMVPVQEVGRLLFRNDVGQDNSFVRVSLRGTRSAPDAFGSVVRTRMRSRISCWSPVINARATTSAMTPTVTPRVEIAEISDRNACLRRATR